MVKQKNQGKEGQGTGRKTAQILKTTAVAKLNGFERRDIFLVRKGPLGRARRLKEIKMISLLLVHQNRTIAIASDFRVDGAKSPEISQKEGVSASEIAARNRKSLATFHRTLKSQCKVSEIASDFWGLRWASQSQIAEIAAISVR